MPPFAVVAAPPATPARYGLLLSANTPTDGPEVGDRWIQGFKWAPESCGGGGLILTCGTVARDLSDAQDENEAVQQYEPFLAWVPEVCSAMSRGRDVDEARGRARRKLLACESKLIEAELWSGTIAQAEGLPNAWLADEANVDDLDTGGTPVAVRDALAGLEEGLAACSCGGRGMIHATVSTVTHWFAEGLLRREGQYLLTALDTIVVAGQGYDGSAPDGTAATGQNAWAYGTGIVDVRRTASVDIPGSGPSEWTRIDVNTVELIAQKPVAATFDPCCRIGLNVDLTTRG